MFKNWWDALMRAKNNSLKVLPKTARLQIMVYLSMMWSIIFCLSLGIMYFYDELILIHIPILLMGIFGTGWIFSVFRQGD